MKFKIGDLLVGIFVEIFKIIEDLIAIILFIFAAFVLACAVTVYTLEMENRLQIIIILLAICFSLIYVAKKIRSQNI